MMYSTLASGVINIGLLTSIGMTLLTKMPKMQLPKDNKTENKKPSQKDQRKRVGRVDALAPTRSQQAKKTAAKQAATAKKAPNKKR
jgi:hypothetical protein